MNVERLQTACAALPDDWLRPVRDTGIARFTAHGFPTPRQEDWKYTDLSALAERSLAYLTSQPGGPVTMPEPPADSGAGIRIVFLNGRLAPGGPLPALPGLRLTSLADAGPGARQRILMRLKGFRSDPAVDLADLNASFLSGGLLIEVAPGTCQDRAVEILYQSDGRPVGAQPRLLISAGAGSQCTLIERFAGTGAGLTNAVTDLIAEDGARLNYLKLQMDGPACHHVALQRLVLKRDSAVEVLHLDLGAGLARNDLQIELAEPGAACHVAGLFVANDKAHVDNHTRLDHVAPQTTSTEIYRGIAAGSGRGIFNGKIVVHPGADGTDAKLTNRNLLLGAKAEIDTKPELEIYTDDVKCAHGATTGQLDPAALFYLRSRGLDAARARGLLVNAFATEILARIQLPHLREAIERVLGDCLARDAGTGDA